MFPKNHLGLLKGTALRDQQSLYIFRGSSIIQPTLCPPKTPIDPRLRDFEFFSGAHKKCIIREAEDAHFRRWSMHRKSSHMRFWTIGPTRDPRRAPHVISSLRNHLPVPLIASVAMTATARMASTVDVLKTGVKGF